ncbi:MAG TPA: DUF1961 family protein [Chthoniobacteraceae bacterium]|nr:DUF1961 family protein [Chthoniobacteraceae bacterium]
MNGLMAQAATESWSIEEKEGRWHARSAALEFQATPARGGRLQKVRWRGRKGLPELQQLQPVLYSGILYDPRQWSILAEGARGGEGRFLSRKVEGEWLEITGELRVHDLVIATRWRAHAKDGTLECRAEVRKEGPGSIKAQLLWMSRFETTGDPSQPPAFQMDFFEADRLLTCSEFGRQGNVLDQDGHAANRYWVLSSPEVRFRTPGAKDQAVFARVDGPMAGLAAYHRPANRTLSAGLYGSDRMLEGDAVLVSTLTLAPGAIPPEEAPGLPDPRSPEIAAAIDREARPIKAAAAQPAEVSGYRASLHRWLLEEARWYEAEGNAPEASGLLADAARVRRALESGESAALPQPGELIYSNGFRTLPTDWKVFGFGEMRADAEEGLYLAPNTTMNLWSDREFSGDYLVEFSYRPEPMEKMGRGTFLQFSGRTITRRDPVDMMASATGRMPDYNFGMECYHFSFNRQAPERHRTNFRKTGEAFRLLALTERKTAQEPVWHRITASRRGSQFLLYVDGRFILEYFDEGHRGPVHDAGRLGLRNWGGMKAWFRDLKVFHPAGER